MDEEELRLYFIIATQIAHVTYPILRAFAGQLGQSEQQQRNTAQENVSCVTLRLYIFIAAQIG